MTMASLALPKFTIAPCCSSWNWKAASGKRLMFASKNSNTNDSKVCVSVRAFFPNPSSEQPILKEALKEPVAFVGGIFAGLLRLDLNEEPLKEWVSRTVEASGISAEEVSNKGVDYGGGEEEMAQQIEIE